MNEDNRIAQYKLTYPITMAGIKALVLSTMLEYTDYLQG